MSTGCKISIDIIFPSMNILMETSKVTLITKYGFDLYYWDSILRTHPNSSIIFNIVITLTTLTLIILFSKNVEIFHKKLFFEGNY